MNVLELSHLTTEYLRVPVTAKAAGVEVDPTSNGIYFAAIAVDADPAEPGESDYSEGTWDTDAVNGMYYAQWLLDGLDAGRYNVWVKISALPETVQRKIAVLVLD